MVVGIYPIKDGVVRDADDRFILLDDLWEAFHTMDLNVNEAADYASRCEFESFQLPLRSAQSSSESPPEKVLDAPGMEQ